MEGFLVGYGMILCTPLYRICWGKDINICAAFIVCATPCADNG